MVLGSFVVVGCRAEELLLATKRLEYTHGNNRNRSWNSNLSRAG